MPFEGSYMWRLRQKVGHEKVIMPGVCAIITDDANRVLLEYRRDFGAWPLTQLPPLFADSAERLADLRTWQGNVLVK